MRVSNHESPISPAAILRDAAKDARLLRMRTAFSATSFSSRPFSSSPASSSLRLFYRSLLRYRPGCLSSPSAACARPRAAPLPAPPSPNPPTPRNRRTAAPATPSTSSRSRSWPGSDTETALNLPPRIAESSVRRRGNKARTRSASAKLVPSAEMPKPENIRRIVTGPKSANRSIRKSRSMCRSRLYRRPGLESGTTRGQVSA